MNTQTYAQQTTDRNDMWRSTVSRMIAGQGLELIDAEDTTPTMIFGAVFFALNYSAHDDKRKRGYITTTKARAILTGIRSDEPDDAPAILMGFMRPLPCKQPSGAVRWPVNGDHEQHAQDRAWGMVFAIERGWFVYDRSGFLQWSQAGRDRYAAGTSDMAVDSSTGQAAFAF